MGILRELQPDKHVLSIRRATQQLSKKARQVSLGGTWSICELRLDEADLEWLRQWAASLQEEQVRINLRYQTRAADFGLLLLTLASEWCRRNGHERGIYGVFNEFKWDELVRKRLFTPTGYPQTSAREAIEEACKTYGLRHAFDAQSSQPWYLTIKLQFGFTLLGAKDQLNHWLTGIPTDAIELLISKESTSKAKGTRVYSDSFAELWRTLKDFRTGAVRRPIALKAITESPWTMAEWADDLLNAALQPVSNSQATSSTSAFKINEPASLVDSAERDPAVFSTPRVVWHENKVELIADYDQGFLSMLCEECYFVNLNDDGFDVLRRQIDGSYSSLSKSSQISLPTNKSTALISVSDGTGRAITSQILELFSNEDEFQAFNANGRNVPISHMTTERGYTLRLPIGTKFEPDDELGSRFILNESWWVQLQPGWARSATVQLPGDPVPMPILQDHTEAITSWTDSVVVSFETLPPGNQARVIVRCQDVDVTVLSLRVEGAEVAIKCLQSGFVVSEPILVSHLGFDGAIRVRVLAKRQSLRVINKVLYCNRKGLIVQRRTRWESLQAEDSIDATRMSRTLAAVKPGPTERAEGWTLLEGSRRLALAPDKCQRMTDLGCRGWSLHVTDHEFNRVDSGSLQKLVASVVDQGIINCAAQLPGSRCVRIQLNDWMEPGDDHHCVLWTESGRLVNFNASDIRHDGNSWTVDPVSVGVDYDDSVVAAAIGYRGVRLGSWWTDDWWRPITTVDCRETAAAVASCLRWFYLPLIQRSRCVVELVKDYGSAVFDQWCQLHPSHEAGPTPKLNEHRETDPVFACDLLRQNEDEPGWSTTVRAFLSEWKPSPEETVQIAPDVLGIESNQSLEGIVIGFSSTMPIFVGNFVKAWLQAQPDTSAELELRRHLCSELCDPLKKRAQDYFNEFPATGSHPLVPWLPFDEAYVEALIAFATRPGESSCNAEDFETAHNRSELCRLIASQLIHPANTRHCRQTA